MPPRCGPIGSSAARANPAIDHKHLARVLSGQIKVAAAPNIKSPCNRPESYSMVREHGSKDILCRM
jgi:hypothetical protein